jgi:phosphatidylglycerophosphatase A
MKKHVAFVLATWFGLGFSPIAPGTVGTIAALPLYFALRGGGPIAILVAAIALMFAGIWAAGIVAEHTGKHDPQIVVVDEVAGVLVALAFAPHGFKGVATAVIAFRIFDMTKPFPARAAERLPGGWGIVIDDIVAGIWAALFTTITSQVMP